MRILVVSADPDVRHTIAVTVRSLERAGGGVTDVLQAKDGLDGMKLAWRHLPDAVIADEITSRAGAFALARELKGAERPFEGPVVVLLERPEDGWLARWSGVDAWFTKPIDPFELADTLGALLAADHREAV